MSATTDWDERCIADTDAREWAEEFGKGERYYSPKWGELTAIVDGTTTIRDVADAMARGDATPFHEALAADYMQRPAEYLAIGAQAAVTDVAEQAVAGGADAEFAYEAAEAARDKATEVAGECRRIADEAITAEQAARDAEQRAWEEARENGDESYYGPGQGRSTLGAEQAETAAGREAAEAAERAHFAEYQARYETTRAIYALLFDKAYYDAHCLGDGGKEDHYSDQVWDRAESMARSGMTAAEVAANITAELEREADEADTAIQEGSVPAEYEHETGEIAEWKRADAAELREKYGLPPAGTPAGEDLDAEAADHAAQAAADNAAAVAEARGDVAEAKQAGEDQETHGSAVGLEEAQQRLLDTQERAAVEPGTGTPWDQLAPGEWEGKRAAMDAAADADPDPAGWRSAMDIEVPDWVREQGPGAVAGYIARVADETSNHYSDGDGLDEQAELDDTAEAEERPDGMPDPDDPSTWPFPPAAEEPPGKPDERSLEDVVNEARVAAQELAQQQAADEASDVHVPEQAPAVTDEAVADLSDP
ncbi:MAG: hypothetical protein M3460_10920 [Actinomycetota bacterium]|nr:hypothetical protein [Actinomycetota bacterium]